MTDCVSYLFMVCKRARVRVPIEKAGGDYEWGGVLALVRAPVRAVAAEKNGCFSAVSVSAPAQRKWLHEDACRCRFYTRAHVCVSGCNSEPHELNPLCPTRSFRRQAPTGWCQSQREGDPS